MTRMTRRVRNDGLDPDAFTSWRKVFHWQPGVLRYIKRRANKRERREGRREAERGRDE